MKYDVTRICGHKQRINISGSDDRIKWMLNWYSNSPCPDCKIKADREKRLEYAEKIGMAELIGSEKQVNWAIKIRDGLMRQLTNDLAEMQSDMEKITDSAEYEDWKNAYLKCSDAYEALCVEDRASWWIEHRDDDSDALLATKEAESKSPEEEAYNAELEALRQSKVRMVKPDVQKSDTVVYISIKDYTVYAQNNKDEALQDIYHSRQYTWDRDTMSYRHKTMPYLGTAEDHAAELGAILLQAGYPVQFPDETIRDKALTGEYEPEVFRRIWKSEDEPDKLRIRWGNKYDFYGTDILDAATHITGAYKDKPDVVVPIKSFAEIIDFADKWQCKISPEAQEALDAMTYKIIIATPAKTRD